MENSVISTVFDLRFKETEKHSSSPNVFSLAVSLLSDCRELLNIAIDRMRC